MAEGGTREGACCICGIPPGVWGYWLNVMWRASKRGELCIGPLLIRNDWLRANLDSVVTKCKKK